MVLTFILGVIASAAAPFVEDPVKSALSAMNPTVVERRLIAFVVCLVVAAVVSTIVGNGNAVVLTIGAAVGLIVPRILGK